MAYKNLATLLENAGLETDTIGLVNVFIPGSDYRQYINKGWLELFPDENDPIPMSAKIGNVLYSSGISGAPPFTGTTTPVQGLAPQIAIGQWGAETVLEQAGGSLNDLALLTVLVQDFDSIPIVQKHFNRLFPDKTDRPALKFIDWRMPQGQSHVQYHVTSVFEQGVM